LCPDDHLLQDEKQPLLLNEKTSDSASSAPAPVSKAVSRSDGEGKAALGQNYDILDEGEKALADMLVGSAGQDHLFAEWEAPGTDDAAKHSFFESIKKLDGNYPGGVAGYCEQAKKLLKAAASGENPMADVTDCKVPQGYNLKYGDAEFSKFEQIGMEAMKGVCFVLVAGGLGERLGYNGIKIALPTELCSSRCYLEHYISNILALQRRCNIPSGSHTHPSVKLPLAIMVSGDTGARTIKLLKDNKNFGMEEDQVTILQQEKVGALIDSSARLAVDGSPYELLTKPHGHGDVHYLLHKQGLAKKWLKEGRGFVAFFQDTNGLFFNTLCAGIGVAKQLDLQMLSLAVPRKAGQEIGALTSLTFKDGKVCARLPTHLPTRLPTRLPTHPSFHPLLPSSS
jgi:UDP-sugar pyrophosphorylase